MKRFLFLLLTIVPCWKLCGAAPSHGSMVGAGKSGAWQEWTLMIRTILCPGIRQPYGTPAYLSGDSLGH
jgi:hypothetical protein